MPTHFEMLSAEDKPALVAVTTPELRRVAQSALADLGCRVHTTDTHEDCLRRFAQFQYQVVIIEQGFAMSNVHDNASLKALQTMAMPLRRHATIILFGDSFTTLDPMQGFQQSVHAVVNTADLVTFPAILQKVVSDNELFLGIYREAQARQAHGK